MKKALIAIALIFLANIAAGAEGDSIRLTLKPEGKLAVGKPVRITAALTHANGSPVTDAELDVVHTQKFHLLVVDPTLSDYQHIHPKPTSAPGVYSFTFTPKLSGGYRTWADITPAATHIRQYAMADLGAPGTPAIVKKEADFAIVSGYRFGLSFDHPPEVGTASMGGITVTDKKGRLVKTLQPVMGAYAHIVGFYDDYETVVHTHPMDDEPKSSRARGGPTLMFHLSPSRPGFIKLFAQFKIDGKDVFVPFGVKVADDKVETE